MYSLLCSGLVYKFIIVLSICVKGGGVGGGLETQRTYKDQSTLILPLYINYFCFICYQSEVFYFAIFLENIH